MPQNDAMGSNQSRNSRFAWLQEINDRALAGRPLLRPGYRPKPVSVHDAEYAQLVVSLPYYGLVAAAVADVDFVMFSSNDDNVARTYLYYGPDAYETLSLRLWHRLSLNARCVFDIGSFTGLYSLVTLGVNRGCSCVAFEPMPHIRHRARMNFVLNGCTNEIRVEPYALSDETRMLPLSTSVGPTILDSGGSVEARSNGVTVGMDLVQGISLDQYLTANPGLKPDLLKIDVEYHEVAVLSGARQMLEASRPTMVIEVSKQHTFPSVKATLQRLGYRLFSIDERNLSLFEHGPTQANTPAYAAMEDVHNVLAFATDTLEASVLDVVASVGGVVGVA